MPTPPVGYYVPGLPGMPVPVTPPPIGYYIPDDSEPMPEGSDPARTASPGPDEPTTIPPPPSGYYIPDEPVHPDAVPPPPLGFFLPDEPAESDDAAESRDADASEATAPASEPADTDATAGTVETAEPQQDSGPEDAAEPQTTPAALDGEQVEPDNSPDEGHQDEDGSVPATETLAADAAQAEADSSATTNSAATTKQRRRRRAPWLVAVAALAGVAATVLFWQPGLLTGSGDETVPSTLAAPATAAGLDRQPAPLQPAGDIFARWAKKADKTGTVTSYVGDGVSATVWTSTVPGINAEQEFRRYRAAGGPKTGRQTRYPPGPRGGTIYCAAVDSERSICFWGTDWMQGGADVTGLGRTGTARLVADMRIDLEQPPS